MTRRSRKSRPDNTVSPSLKAFGTQVRHYRERTGLSQERLAERFPVTGSYIGQVEQGKTRCTEDFTAKLDGFLSADGALRALWKDLVKNAAFPTWFSWPNIEEEAISMHAFELGVVHGLLQTPAYAGAILRGDKETVEARLKRQEILARKDPLPPELVVLLDETVLHREVGNREVMREQLERLTQVASHRLAVQVVPGCLHLGISGSFTLATLPDRSQVGYVETVARGLTLGDESDIAEMAETLSSLRAQALPVGMSVDMIHKVIAEKWT